MFDPILQAISEFQTIIIHRHSRPDGDALGSQLGLRHILKDSFPDKEILAVGDMSDRYAFMVDEPMDEIPDEAYEGALALVLDTSAKRLISDQRYASERIDVYKGGWGYWTGIWTPTWRSIMKGNSDEFNAPSREAIWKRVMSLSNGPGWTPDYEAFVEYDLGATEQ